MHISHDSSTSNFGLMFARKNPEGKINDPFDFPNDALVDYEPVDG